MVVASEKDYFESIKALKMSLKGNLEKDLTEQESERNVSENLVGIYVIDGITSEHKKLSSLNGRCGSGLMITTNGFIITAYHNIQNKEEEWKKINKKRFSAEGSSSSLESRMKYFYYIADQEGNSYPIDTSFWVTNDKMDIALIKAITNKKPKPVRFKIADKPHQVGDEIKLLGIKNHRQYNQYGRVVVESYNIRTNKHKDGQVQPIVYDTFLTDAYGVPGFSGGIFTDIHGGVSGLALYTQTEGTGQIGKAGGAKVKNIVQLVEESVRGLDKVHLTMKR